MRCGSSGIFTLCGKTSNCFARYQITFNGNVSLPEGGTVVPIAVAHLSDKLRELMEDAPDEHSRRKIQRLIDEMDG